ncbi:armadillo repeat-containing protein 3 isoform X1 [Cephus cinctus]|uniref:Armadillo repeat-containing protein 3 isoform X1 n=3 Tax=Cephus cinctus TaxID=211228 RepID=A0AAJ7RAS7_CEPCN|nr:armadillo repeat-containing protein 3 isoform X1 [Cephus cinctus]
MIQKDPGKCLSTGKERQDRTVQLKSKLDLLSIDVKNPGTAVLLLQCQENSVLIAAVAALSKFASKAQENLEILFECGILEKIVPLMNHEDTFTRRFASKLLAEMAAIPLVRNVLLECEDYVPHFTKVLQNDTDVFAQEFSSLILAHLSKDMYGVAQILNQCPRMDFLFERIQSSDPDVKKNSIEIIYNLLEDPVGFANILGTKTFSFPLIYKLLAEPYPVIQKIALDVLENLVSRNKDDQLQENFQSTGGLQALLNILDNDEWIDVHSKTLNVLALASDNIKTVELLNNIGGILRLFKYMENAMNSKLRHEAFSIIVRLANSSTGRKALYNYGIIDYLLETVAEAVTFDFYEVSCYGIAKMTLDKSAAQELALKNPIKKLLDILKNENLKWFIRQAASFALKELLKADRKNCKNFLDVKGQTLLLWLLKQPIGKISAETQIIAIEALSTVVEYAEFNSTLLNADLVDAMCSSFESKYHQSDELPISSCQAIGKICIDKHGRDLFIRVNGPVRLYNLLKSSESLPVKNAAVQLIQELSADSSLAALLIKAGCFTYMTNEQTDFNIISSWKTCKETLLAAYLPAKFAFTGRLSLHDVTQDGFYVMRRTFCPFPILDDLFRLKICPLDPIYVINFSQPPSDYQDTLNLQYEKEKSQILGTRRTSTRTSISRKSFASIEVINSAMEWKFGKLQPDPYLYEYLELFKCKLIANEIAETSSTTLPGLANMSFIESRARLLGKFVARQMSGPDPDCQCRNHQFDIHISEIKLDIETSVIPLGQVRVGSFLERALLFKVMADKICLPTALVRGQYGKAWVEIAIPKIELLNKQYLKTPSSVNALMSDSENKRTNTSKQLMSLSINSERNLPYDNRNLVTNRNRNSVFNGHKQPIFPTKLLRPNFIVDLIYNPGDLLPIGSLQAKKYCDEIIA